MLKTLITVLSFSATASYAQMLDLAEKQTRLQFEIPAKNKADDIKASNITTEKIYVFYPNHSGAEDSILNTVISYDDNGRITESKEFNRKRNIEKTYQYFFDDSGTLTKQRIASTEDKKSFHYTEIVYNTAGLEIFKYDYDNDSVNMQVLKKEYNDQTRCSRMQVMEKDGQFKTLKEYTYDYKGNLTKVELFYAYQRNGIPSKTIYFQGVNDNHTELVFMEDTKMAEYHYDDGGRCIEEVNQTYHASSTTSAEGKLTVSSNQFGSPYYTAEEFTIPASLYQTTSTNLLLSTNRINEIVPEPIAKPGNGGVFSVADAASYTHYKKGESGKQHLFNSNGTIKETAVLSDGNIIAIIKHVYQTK